MTTNVVGGKCASWV